MMGHFTTSREQNDIMGHLMIGPLITDYLLSRFGNPVVPNLRYGEDGDYLCRRQEGPVVPSEKVAVDL